MRETEHWFLDMASVLTEDGRLGPAKAMMKWLRQAVEEIGWERMKQAAEALGLNDGLTAMAMAETAAAQWPDLPCRLQSSEGRMVLDQWHSQHEEAVEEFRRLSLSLIRLAPPTLRLHIQPSEGANPGWEQMWRGILSLAKEGNNVGRQDCSGLGESEHTGPDGTVAG